MNQIQINNKTPPIRKVNIHQLFTHQSQSFSYSIRRNEFSDVRNQIQRIIWTILDQLLIIQMLKRIKSILGKKFNYSLMVLEEKLKSNTKWKEFDNCLTRPFENK